MALLSGKRTSAASAALSYVTVGALMIVWSLVWYWYLNGSEAPRRLHYYLCYGFLGTGTILLLIGLGVGGWKAARKAEPPPNQTTAPVAQAGQAVPTAPSTGAVVNAPQAVPVGRPVNQG